MRVQDCTPGTRVRLTPAAPRTRSFRPVGSLGTVREALGDEMPGWVLVTWDDPAWNDDDVPAACLEPAGLDERPAEV